VLSPSGWEKLGYYLWSDLKRNFAVYLFAIPAFLLLLKQKKKLRATLQSIGKQPVETATGSFKYTVEALLFTVLLASIRPAMMWFVAWRMVGFSGVEEFPRAIAAGLGGMAIVWVTVQFLRGLFLADGLGEAHLKWKVKNPEVILNNLRWLGFILLPAAFIVAMFQWEGSGVYRGSIGRVAFMAAMVGLAIFARRIFHHNRGISFKSTAAIAKNKTSKVYYLLSATGVAIPIILAVISGFGFYYTAFVLTTRLMISLWLLLAFVLADSLLGRWLYIIKWKLMARERSLEKELAEEKDEEKIEAQKAEPKISDISEQTRKLQRMFVGVLLVIGLWVTWVDVLPALGILDNVEVWSRTVKENITEITEGGGQIVTVVSKTMPVTLSDVCLSVIIIIITVIATRNIPGLLEISLLRRLPIDFGIRFAITTISKNVIVIVGVVMAFATIGIGWAKVQWLVAAMTVGLGFGLQEIFANFISGIIILLEQPIRVGDTVTVGDINGTVTRIRARATTITTWAKKELIVPNKEFITGRLVNWSLSDKIVRVEVPVGIAYGSDTKLAHEILLKVAAEHPMVVDDPPPLALFLDFGNSSLDFELRTYIKGIDFFFEVRDELHTAVDMAFREANITIAFPQRDLHLRTVNTKVPIENIVHEDGPGA
jgi:potassium-dependent mechanosensitive channel